MLSDWDLAYWLLRKGFCLVPILPIKEQGAAMILTDGITDQTIIIPMDITHGEWKLKSLISFNIMVYSGIHDQGSIIITPQVDTTETAGTGARGQQRPRPDIVTS